MQYGKAGKDDQKFNWVVLIKDSKSNWIKRRTTADTYVTFIHISFTDHAYIRKNNPSKYTCTSVYGMSLKVR